MTFTLQRKMTTRHNDYDLDVSIPLPDAEALFGHLERSGEDLDSFVTGAIAAQLGGRRHG